MAVLEWHGELAVRLVEDAGKGALKLAAADLQRKSAEQAPIDTGDLRSNCNASDVIRSGDALVVTVGYSLPYARRQHECLHYKHPRGGKAKYLEDPYKENAREYENMIVAAIRQALR